MPKRFYGCSLSTRFVHQPASNQTAGSSKCPLKDKGCDDVNFVVFRENTEGLYAGIGGQFKRGTLDEVAIEQEMNTRKGVERIIRQPLICRQTRSHQNVYGDKANAASRSRLVATGLQDGRW